MRYDAVDYLYSKGIMNGTSSTKFSPNGELTRAMVVTILYRAQGEPAVHTSGSFKDVAAGCYYTEAVEWAVAEGILTSVQARNAVQNATRAEVAMAIYTYLTKIAK